MNRRQAITYLLSIVGGVAPVTSHARISVYDAGFPQLLRRLGQEVIDIQRIGNAYLIPALVSGEFTSTLSWFKRVLSSSSDPETVIRHTIAEDLENGRLIQVDGWYVSLTQARVAALSAALL